MIDVAKEGAEVDRMASKSKIRASPKVFLVLLVVGMVPLTYARAQQERLNRALLAATEANDLPAVHRLLHDGANPNYYYDTSESASEYLSRLLAGKRAARPVIMPSAYHGRVAIVTTLLDSGADVNSIESDGSTPLMWAAQQGHTDLVKVLLARGAKVRTRDRDGRTALMRAIWSGNPATVEALLRCRADVDATNMRGQTALKMAAQQRNAVLIRLLKEAGAKE